MSVTMESRVRSPEIKSPDFITILSPRGRDVYAAWECQRLPSSIDQPGYPTKCGSARMSPSDHPEAVDRMTRPDNGDATPEVAGGGKE